MKIPLFRPYIEMSDMNYIGNTLTSRWLSEGDVTKEFERKIANISGREYGIAVTSGSVAIYMAVKQEAIGNVSMTDYCVLSPYNAIRMADKQVTLTDIDKETLSQEDISEYGVNLLVHFNNRKSKLDMDNKHIIHDISHCIGTDFSDVIGTLCISFSTPKTVTTGQGGMILTDDKNLYKEYKKFKDHGRFLSSDNMSDGYMNFKYNEILAAFGLAQINKLDFLLEEKRRVCSEYKKHIKVSCPDTPWIIVHKSNRAVQVCKELETIDVMAMQLYKPIHELAGCSYLTYPNSKWAYENMVYLPSYAGLSAESIEMICDKINEVES